MYITHTLPRSTSRVCSHPHPCHNLCGDFSHLHTATTRVHHTHTASVLSTTSRACSPTPRHAPSHPHTLTHSHTHTHTYTHTHTCAHAHMYVHTGTPSTHRSPALLQPALAVAATFVGWARTIYLDVFTVYIRYFKQGNHHTYGHTRCVYTVLANPIHLTHSNYFCNARYFHF
jgi:hypothetical protein